MVMVPEDAYSNLIYKQQQLIPPVVTQLSNLDQDMKEILESPNLTVDEKYNRYYKTFSRYGQLQNTVFPTPQIPAPAVPPPQPDLQQQQQPAPPAAEVPVVEKNLLDSLPKTSRKKGRMLLEHFKHKKDIRWADTGELVINGAPLPKSNITDLVHFFTRNRPTVVPPSGAKELADLLQETNVPMEAVMADSLKQLEPQDLGLGTLFSPFDRKPPTQVSPERKRSPLARQTPLKTRLRQTYRDNIAEGEKPGTTGLQLQNFY